MVRLGYLLTWRNWSSRPRIPAIIQKMQNMPSWDKSTFQPLSLKSYCFALRLQFRIRICWLIQTYQRWLIQDITKGSVWKSWKSDWGECSMKETWKERKRSNKIFRVFFSYNLRTNSHTQSLYSKFRYRRYKISWETISWTIQSNSIHSVTYVQWV